MTHSIYRITLGKVLTFELGGTNFHPELSVLHIYS